MLLEINLDIHISIPKERKETILRNAGSYLVQLLPPVQYEGLRKSLEDVVERACETWELFQYSESRYEHDLDPLEWGDEEWECFSISIPSLEPL